MKVKTVPKYVTNTVIFCLFMALPIAVLSGFVLVPLGVLMGLPFLFFIYKTRDFKLSLNPLVLSVIIFSAWGILSSIWAIDNSYSLKSSLKFGFLIILSIFIIQALSRAKMPDISKYIFFSFIIGGLFFLEEIFFDQQAWLLLRSILNPNPDTPYYPSLNNLNKGASFMVIFLWPVICLACLKYKNYIFPFILWSFAALTVFNLENMSASLALACATVTFIFVVMTKAKFNKLIMASVLLILCIKPVMISNIDPYKAIEDFPELPPSSVHRLLIWDFVAEKAAEKPILGWGMKSARKIPGSQDKMTLERTFVGRELIPGHPHSSILQIWLEVGLIGAILFLYAIYCLFKQIGSIKGVYGNASANAMLVGYIVIGLLSFDLFRVWWIAAGTISVSLLTIILTNYEERPS